MGLASLRSVTPRKVRLRAALILAAVTVACFALLALDFGVHAALVVTAFLLAAGTWIVSIAQAREILFDSGRKTVTVRWRNAVLVRHQVELSLERFSHVASYHPFGRRPTIVVALVERAGDRELVVDAFSAQYEGRRFWSSLELVEGEAARRLRRDVSTTTGLPDGGYRGTAAALPPSERPT
ncbi:hypothetical protein [Ramlibacter pallidus]|uniref:DUF2244 domain-containing protein n=1 Tax=Ramlibacter pallidus TaxID=2780087 RepID=A0ABR9S3B5_9BURK|nr:hypothetical protein [Ramlibacter pallidus]MBE7368003.1 hypothetical protein [Ramlibacter pallidus]